MKNNAPRNSIAIIAALLCSSLAMADRLPTLIPISQVVELIIKRGFSQISEIELSDNQDKYEVKAFDSQRCKVEIEMDAHTGVIVEIDVGDCVATIRASATNDNSQRQKSTLISSHS